MMTTRNQRIDFTSTMVRFFVILSTLTIGFLFTTTAMLIPASSSTLSLTATRSQSSSLSVFPILNDRSPISSSLSSSLSCDCLLFGTHHKRHRRRRGYSVKPLQAAFAASATSDDDGGDDRRRRRLHRSLIESYNDNNNNNPNLSSSSSSSQSSFNNGLPISSPTATTRIIVTSRRDQLIARAAKVRQSLVKQQAELIELERQIACCGNGGGGTTTDDDESGSDEPLQLRRLFMDSNSMNSNSNIKNDGLVWSVQNFVKNTYQKFNSSSLVLKRKLDRVQARQGRNNAKFDGSVWQYIGHELEAAIRIGQNLVSKPEQISYLVDPQTPTLITHVPAILARLDKLEIHVTPILERVLNNRQHLASIEPYLDEILERFDDIEPHLTWILDNIDTLAPYTGLLLKHIDALLLYAEVDDEIEKKQGNDGEDDSYSLANQLLPYLEYYVSKLDVIGPHLVYLRPHVPLLLKRNRIARVSPHIDKLFARGYNNLGASANLDILIFWFGWCLRIPGLPRLFFALPFSPRLVTFLANRLPKKFARRGKQYCRNMECSIDGDYGLSWNKLESKSSSL